MHEYSRMDQRPSKVAPLFQKVQPKKWCPYFHKQTNTTKQNKTKIPSELRLEILRLASVISSMESSSLKCLKRRFCWKNSVGSIYNRATAKSED